MPRVLAGVKASLANSTITGVGITMEGIWTNYPMFEVTLQQAWKEHSAFGSTGSCTVLHGGRGRSEKYKLVQGLKERQEKAEAVLNEVGSPESAGRRTPPRPFFSFLLDTQALPTWLQSQCRQGHTRLLLSSAVLMPTGLMYRRAQRNSEYRKS